MSTSSEGPLRGQLLNINPLVAVFDGVFDTEMAEAVIEAGRDTLRPAAYGTDEGVVVGEKRTNLQAPIDQWSHPMVAELVTRISSLVRLPPEHSEPAKLLRYEGEQFFDVHVDGFADVPAFADELAKGGQRLFTTLCYLNDVEGEGQTAFPRLKLAVRPKLGRVLVFSNTTPGQTTPHPDSTHAGFSASGGLKWALSLWWRERAYHEPRRYPEAEGDFVEY